MNENYSAYKIGLSRDVYTVTEKSFWVYENRDEEIISYLADEPYEVVIERKALSRVLHNLRDSQIGIYTDKRRGAWHMGGSLKN